MNYYYITFRSITGAQRAVKIFERAGITSRLLRTPKNLITDGCSYSVRIHESRIKQVVNLMREAGLRYNKVFLMYADGSNMEVRL